MYAYKVFKYCLIFKFLLLLLLYCRIADRIHVPCKKIIGESQ